MDKKQILSLLKEYLDENVNYVSVFDRTNRQCTHAQTNDKIVKKVSELIR